jgi:hypothetical protein
LAVVILGLLAEPVKGYSVGFYTPPCLDQLNDKDDALFSLERCLVKKSKPPFKGDEEVGPLPICSKEMQELLVKRETYKNCLEGKHSQLPGIVNGHQPK